MIDPEQRLRPLDGQLLERVDEALALVVALAGVALGVLVREDGAGRLEDVAGDVVLRGDHPQCVALALGLEPDELGYSLIVHRGLLGDGTQARGATIAEAPRWLTPP
ncbi:hypothetical protein GCM10018962_93700 [Dactylosporangium matsuzakiense]